MRSILRHRGVSAVSCPPRHEDKASLSCIAQELLHAREPGRRDEANTTVGYTSQAWRPAAKFVLILEAIAARNRVLQFHTGSPLALQLGGLCWETSGAVHEAAVQSPQLNHAQPSRRKTALAPSKSSRLRPLQAPSHTAAGRFGQQADDRTQYTLAMRMKGRVYAESTWRALSDA